jgi:hypothetical protein
VVASNDRAAAGKKGNDDQRNNEDSIYCHDGHHIKSNDCHRINIEQSHTCHHVTYQAFRFDYLFLTCLASQILNLPENPAPTNGDLFFASHNPTKDVLLSHVCPQKKLTDAEKVSANTKCELNRENANALKIEVNAFFNHHDLEISWLAKKFNKTEGNIKLMLANESNYQNKCAPSLQNALVHAKGLEMNKGMKSSSTVPQFGILTHVFSGLEQESQLKLAQLQKLVEDNTNMQDLLKAQRQEFIDDLQIYYDTKQIGSCTFNTVAAIDCQRTVDRISNEVCISYPSFRLN